MKYLLIIIPLFFMGCVTKEGIFYKKPECSENYGLYGTYYKDCRGYLIKFRHRDKKICLDCN